MSYTSMFSFDQRAAFCYPIEQIHVEIKKRKEEH
jgi:hypothetical protein